MLFRSKPQTPNPTYFNGYKPYNMSLNPQHQLKSTVMTESPVVIKKIDEMETRISNFHAKTSYNFDISKKEIKKLDIEGMRFFLKKRTKKIIQSQNEVPEALKHTSKEPKSLSKVLRPGLSLNTSDVPKTPMVFRPCRFISSVNSSRTKTKSKSSIGPRLSMSPDIRPSVSDGDSPFQGLMRLGKVAIDKSLKMTESQSYRRSQKDFSACSKERKARLELELKRSHVVPYLECSSRLPESNEMLHKEYIRFKCHEQVVKLKRSYVALNI